ncbi:MAG: hypothetical protein OXF85_02945 [Candidatus Saccharibacteria bacterium]|nr:hypothetical protein [Candidatus Saccharibacteria bacterium]
MTALKEADRTPPHSNDAKGVETASDTEAIVDIDYQPLSIARIRDSRLIDLLTKYQAGETVLAEDEEIVIQNIQNSQQGVYLRTFFDAKKEQIRSELYLQRHRNKLVPKTERFNGKESYTTKWHPHSPKQKKPSTVFHGQNRIIEYGNNINGKIWNIDTLRDASNHLRWQRYLDPESGRLCNQKFYSKNIMHDKVQVKLDSEDVYRYEEDAIAIDHYSYADNETEEPVWEYRDIFEKDQCTSLDLGRKKARFLFVNGELHELHRFAENGNLKSRTFYSPQTIENKHLATDREIYEYKENTLNVDHYDYDKSNSQWVYVSSEVYQRDANREYDRGSLLEKHLPLPNGQFRKLIFQHGLYGSNEVITSDVLYQKNKRGHYKPLIVIQGQTEIRHLYDDSEEYEIETLRYFEEALQHKTIYHRDDQGYIFMREENHLNTHQRECFFYINGVIESAIKYARNDKGWLITTVFRGSEKIAQQLHDKNEKLRESVIYGSNFTAETKINDNGETYYTATCQYDDNSNRLISKFIERKNYPSRKQFYNKHNQLLHSEEYSRDELGRLVKDIFDRNDQLMKRELHDSNDKLLQRVYFDSNQIHRIDKFDKQGRLRIIEGYDIHTKSLVRHIYDKKGIKRYENYYHYENNVEKLKISYQFNALGKLDHVDAYRKLRSYIGNHFKQYQMKQDENKLWIVDEKILVRDHMRFIEGQSASQQQRQLFRKIFGLELPSHSLTYVTSHFRHSVQSNMEEG